MEKLASAEIAESRERFEKWFKTKYPSFYLPQWWEQEGRYPHGDAQVTWTAWQAVERDTRERCAQLAIGFFREFCVCGADDEAWKKKNAGKMYNTESGHSLDCPVDDAFIFAERIRGVNR